MAGRDESLDVERTTIDGIPTYWADAPGRFQGTAIFRVGRADETLRSGGISHLVEHLALYPFQNVEYGFGGMTDDTRTIFFARGEPEEVVGFLGQVCRNLRSLPTERVEEERRVLRAEGADGGRSHPLWRLRFGPSTYGLTAYPEFGMHWLEGQQVQEWADSRFTRRNVALWFTGEPPEMPALELPEGERSPPPQPASMAELDLPAWSTGADAGVAVSLLVPRSVTMNAATSLLIERLGEHLRRELGLSYATGGNYWRLNADQAQIIIGSDGAPGHGKAVRDGVLTVLDEFADRGPTQEQLDRFRTLVNRHGDDPERIPYMLDSHASDELAGAQSLTEAEIAAEHQALTPEAIAAEFQAAMEEMIMLVPSGLSVERMKRYGIGEKQAPVKGKTYGSDSSGTNSHSVTVGEEGVTQRVGSDSLTVRFDRCVLAALDGSYAVTLFDPLGEELWFRYKGDDARRHITETVTSNLPADRVVRLNPEQAERFKEVADLADEQLGDHKGWALSALPGVLYEGERAEFLARGVHVGQGGLLVVTNLRLLFINDDADRLLLEVPREAVRGVEGSQGLRRGSVAIRDDTAAYAIDDVSPRGRAKAIQSLLAGDDALHINPG